MSQTFAQLINGKSATVEFSTGSASTPSVAFSGDTNTGIYSPGADQVAISTNGSGRLFVNSSGQTSIGTASPDGRLTIQRPSNNQGIAAGISLKGQDGTTQGGLGTDGVNDNFVQLLGAQGIKFHTNNTDGTTNERLRITSAGLVGVGTSSPAAQLDVAGGDIYVRTGGRLLSDTVQGYTGGATPLALNAANTVTISTVSTERLRIDSSGRVGIGTSSPVGLLHAQGIGSYTGSSSIAFLDGNTTGLYIGSHYDGSGAGVDFASRGYSSTMGDFRFIATNGSFAGNTTRMVIDSSGRVGIGTASPGTRLEVSAADGEFIRINTTTSAGGYMAFRTNTVNMGFIGAGDQLGGGTATDLNVRSQNSLTFCTNGGNERARIDSSGRLLVGTSSESAYSRAIFAGRSDGNAAGLVKLQSTNSAPASGDTIGNLLYGVTGATTTQAVAEIYAARDGGTWTNNSSMPGRLVFSTTADGASSSTERMRLTQQGVLKVSNDGTYANSTGPYHEFVSSHNDEYAFRVWHRGNASQQYGIYVRTTTDQNDATRTFLECAGNVTLRAAIRSNGGLANYSANNANLSDRNAKKDITPAAGTWDCIKEWEIVNYRYKDQPDDADLNLGVIAQQVAESCPEVITVFSEAKDAKPAVLDDDGNEVEPAQEAQPEKLGVKEQQMYWMAIKALQEAQVRIESLEAINADLLARVTALESV